MDRDGHSKRLFVIAKDELLAHYHVTGNGIKLLEARLVKGILRNPAGI